jgi:DNA-binding transcriptional LysR family regulator
VAYNQGSKEADAFREALLTSGNAAGTSTNQLAGLAAAMGQGFGNTVGKSAEVLAQFAASGQVGRVRVAFTGLAMATVLPRILHDFHRRHPGIRLELTESPTSAQTAALQSGELACGFFHPDTPTPALRTHELLRERNGVLLPAKHPLAPRMPLRLRDLAATPFVLFPRTHNPGFYDRILAAFSSAGVTPRIAEEIWPRANGIGLVRAGLGATFMTPSEAKNLPPEVTFRPINGPAPESRLVLGWRELPPPDPALAAFLAIAGAATKPARLPR